MIQTTGHHLILLFRHSVGQQVMSADLLCRSRAAAIQADATKTQKTDGGKVGVGGSWAWAVLGWGGGGSVASCHTEGP